MNGFGFNDRAFNDTGFASQTYSGTWINAYSFYYEAGATVYITPTVVCACPDGTITKLYFSEDQTTWYEAESGTTLYVPFLTDVSGTTNLYCKIELFSGQSGLTPEISSLTILVHQQTSLYTIATQVLADGLTDVNGEYDIDIILQEYPIPYSWLASMSHRAALKIISSACGGVAFQDRHGVVRVQSGEYLAGIRSTIGNVFDINNNRIYSLESPASDISNTVSVTTLPYEALDTAVVWTLSGTNTLSAGESKTFTASYSDYDAVDNAVAAVTGTGASITAANYYYSGAEITVTATSAVTIGLTISGNPLQITGSEVVELTDGDSIRRYGVKATTIDDNNLIQTKELANLVAESVLNLTKDALRKIEMTWRGDPRIELGDIGTIVDNQAAMVSIEHSFDGTFEQTCTLRRIADE